MKTSIYTPTNNIKFLKDLRESVKSQSIQDFEWIILLNGEANNSKTKEELQNLVNNDPRVRIINDTYDGPNKSYVGRLKKVACSYCTGDILMEIDHDDEITPDCIEEVQKTFESDDDIVFVYSNSVNVNTHDGKISGRKRSEYYGREFRPYKYKGVDVREAVSPDPSPQNLSRIYFAPNHVRAYRKTAYLMVGGYDENMKISDDHDLGLKIYLIGKVHWIDKPLYIYKVHGDNTRLQHVPEIEKTMRNCFEQYIQNTMIKWSRDNNLLAIDLGGALDCPEGLESVDRHNAKHVMDLNETRKFDDNSIGFIRAYDILEHLKDPIHTMNEAYRVLAHGGIMKIRVPSDCGFMLDGKYIAPEGASCDPTHVSRWNKRSFRYYTEPQMRRYIEPECNCKFVPIKPAQESLIYGLPYITVTLMADKGGKRYHGENLRR